MAAVLIAPLLYQLLTKFLLVNITLLQSEKCLIQDRLVAAMLLGNKIWFKVRVSDLKQPVDT